MVADSSVSPSNQIAIGRDQARRGGSRSRKPESSFRYFNSSPEVTRLVVLMFVRFSLSLRTVEDLLLKCASISAMRVGFWWNRCGPIFAGSG